MQAMVKQAANKLNLFPAKHGLLQYYSPHMILTHKALDYQKHCQYALGLYVLAHNELLPTNTNAPRAFASIHL